MKKTVKRMTVPLDGDLERDLERARREIEGKTGLKASMGAVASGLLRKALRAPDRDQAA